MDNQRKHFRNEVKRIETENDPRSLLGLANDTGGRLVDTPLRKKLERRAKQQKALVNHIVPKELQKTPSQKKSESFRKKLARRGGGEIKTKAPSDCRGCMDHCNYDRDLSKCPKPSAIVRCRGCGEKVEIRLILGQEWTSCPICASRRKL